MKAYIKSVMAATASIAAVLPFRGSGAEETAFPKIAPTTALVTRNDQRMTIENKRLRVSLDPTRNYCVVSLVTPDAPTENMIAPVSLSFSATSKTESANEYYGRSTIKSACRVETNGERTYGIINEKWPTLDVTKTIVFFGDKPYFQVKYKVEVTRDCKAERLTLIVGATGDNNLLCFPDDGKASYKQGQPGEHWFTVPRDDSARWLSFISEKRGQAFSVIGADAFGWGELPPRLLCVNKKDGGFNVELIKKQKGGDLRAGDRFYFDLFIYVSGDVADIANHNNQILSDLFPN